MKKLRKILIWTFSIGLMTALLLFAAFAIYLETSINRVMTEEEQSIMYESIENAPALPANFLTTVEMYYPDYFETSVWVKIMDVFTNFSSKRCQCLDLNLPFFIRSSNIFSQYIVALELEEKYSHKRCYEYNMYISDFGHGASSVNEAAELFYKKALDELTEREVVELNIIRFATTRYSPVLNPDNLKMAADQVMKQK